MKEKKYSKIVILSLMLAFVVTLITFVAFNSKVFAKELDEIRFCDSANVTYETESINYSRIEVVDCDLASNFPEYTNRDNNLNSGCANNAGANIIGYYDSIFSNLIPGINTSYIRSGKLCFYPMLLYKKQIQAVINQLYIDMETNVIAPGTSKSEYNRGITRYVERKGYHVSFENVKNNSGLDTNKAKTAFKNKKPITIFTDGYNLCTINNKPNKVEIIKGKNPSAHVMAAYGLKQIKYYNSNNVNFRTDTFLKVSSGLNAPQSGYYLVNEADSNLIFAEIAKVY